MENIKKTCGNCVRRNNVSDYAVVCRYCEHAEFFTPEHVENHCDDNKSDKICA